MKIKLWELINKYSEKVIKLKIEYSEISYYSFLEKQRIKTEIQIYQEIIDELVKILKGKENGKTN